jgi:hypothetical protein
MLKFFQPMSRRQSSSSAKATLSRILEKAATKYRYVPLAWVRARMPEVSPSNLRGYFSAKKGSVPRIGAFWSREFSLGGNWGMRRMSFLGRRVRRRR